MQKIIDLVKAFFDKEESNHKEQVLALLTPTKDTPVNKYVPKLYFDGLMMVKKFMGTDVSEQFLEYLDYVVTPEYAKNDYAYHLIRGMCVGGNMNSPFCYELRPTEHGWRVEILSEKGETVGTFDYWTTDETHHYTLSVQEIITALDPIFVQLEYERIHGPKYKNARNSFSGRLNLDGFAHRRNQLRSVEEQAGIGRSRMWQPAASDAHVAPSDPFGRNFSDVWCRSGAKNEMTFGEALQHGRRFTINEPRGYDTKAKADQEPSSSDTSSDNSGDSE